MDEQDKEVEVEESQEAAPQVAEPETAEVEAPPKKRGRPRLSSPERKAKRAAANKSYYQRTRAAMRQPEEPEEEVIPEEPKPKARPRTKPAPVVRTRPRVAVDPPSPREALRQLWREVRVSELERKRQRYSSWLDG